MPPSLRAKVRRIFCWNIRFEAEECAEILRGGGLEAETAADERLTGAEDSVIADRFRSEGRVLITLDLDFANIRAYPGEYAGIKHAVRNAIACEMVVAEALDFPGAVTQGFDLPDARLMIASAMEDLAQCLLEEGKPLPTPKPDAVADADLIELIPLSVHVGAPRA
jgi:predicted RNase H-like HicB family nuclease